MDFYCVMPRHCGRSIARKFIMENRMFNTFCNNNYRKMHGLPMKRRRALAKVRRTRYMALSKKYDTQVMKALNQIANKYYGIDPVIGFDIETECEDFSNEVWLKQRLNALCGQRLLNPNAVVTIKTSEESEG